MTCRGPMWSESKWQVTERLKGGEVISIRPHLVDNWVYGFFREKVGPGGSEKNKIKIRQTSTSFMKVVNFGPGGEK